MSRQARKKGGSRLDGNTGSGLHGTQQHDIDVSASGLVTVTGGKWTTYRAIAEEVVDECIANGALEKLAPCRTLTLALVAAGEASMPSLVQYGRDSTLVEQMPGADASICGSLTEGMVRFSIRYEFARNVEDILARRTRILFLDARSATACSSRVAQIIRDELDVDPGLKLFQDLAAQYAGVT
ncbi:glycerol-3-phosphate dehydrogenase C-terminal domain-containing protein [Variovorax sp. PAMC 28711]|uniref:glycerol-3-phosphate dehydrogenase C-terminal domain-containing protein n=1 Tax=Variovorax sp. PAMC 28711 TaxID=1795631 RepID=UPI0012E7A3FA|nr:glycerol-3-phosphate dehydrogenase C-terminal domain-containing protein [Variovorax sp. PAMC 28711]